MTRPLPTKSDRQAAIAFVDTAFADCCPVWLANNRDRLITGAADAFMIKRMDAENRARFDNSKRKAA